MKHPPERQRPVIVRGKRHVEPAALRPRPLGAGQQPFELEPPAGTGTGGAAPTARSQPRTEPRPQPEALAQAEAYSEGQGQAEAEVAALRAQVQERTADLQCVKAEYDNYRKRVQRDRLAVREIAVVNVLTGLLPVLDAIGRAREHGEVTGGFHRVAEALETHLASLGLASFGCPGDPFDPALHECVLHTRTANAERPTCTTVLRPGYRVGGHLLRPAEVAVAEPPAGTGTREE